MKNIIINQWAHVLCSVQYCDTSCLVQLMSHDSPYLAHQGQCVPPAVGQQHPHVPGLLHHGGPSPLTKCSHVCVCVCPNVENRGKGEKGWKGKEVYIRWERMTEITQALTSALVYTCVNSPSMHAKSCSGWKVTLNIKVSNIFAVSIRYYTACI